MMRARAPVNCRAPASIGCKLRTSPWKGLSCSELSELLERRQRVLLEEVAIATSCRDSSRELRAFVVAEDLAIAIAER